MDFLIWILDKLFIIALFWVGMKLMDRKIRILIMDTINFIKGGAGGKMPTWKDALGVFAMQVAPEAGKVAVEGLKNWATGGKQPGQLK